MAANSKHTCDTFLIYFTIEPKVEILKHQAHRKASVRVLTQFFSFGEALPIHLPLALHALRSFAPAGTASTFRIFPDTTNDRCHTIHGYQASRNEANVSVRPK